ncbi:MAG: class I SAM-dependent methyltransferase [Paracoccaceae bacterium]
MLRGTAFGGSYGKIRMLYSLEDPWEMTSEREQFRFGKTMEHLRAVRPHFKSILEFGSGEGHQSAYLRTICDELYGAEISKTAIARAARRCPEANFAVAALEDATDVFGDRHFDLITACEVLYYAVDIPSILKALQNRADRIYVTNYHPLAERMRPHFAAEGWRALGEIRFEDTVWECFLWEAPTVR